MSLKGNSIISIDDLTNSEITAILDQADEFDKRLKKETIIPICAGKKLFALFYEPSSRTYFSFREAMRRLGGDWDGVLNAQLNTSVAKGESIADSVRTFEFMGDLIVIRHPYDGSARLASEYASKPIINGGDGAHEHPTQTLVDLYTIRKEKGTLKGQVVALSGDLLHARTAHSLAYALARVGAKIRTIAIPGLGFPTYVRARLQRMKCDLQEYDSVSEALQPDSVVVYQAEQRANGGRRRQLPGQSSEFGRLLSELDVLYLTRLQRERFRPDEQERDVQNQVITSKLLKSAPEGTIVLHPLPRLNEIAYDVDADTRAAYFRQMKNSIPVRMAIIALLLGAVETKGTRGKHREQNFVKVPEGTRCVNENCVVNKESYVTPSFVGDPENPRLVSCAYCDQEVPLETRLDTRAKLQPKSP